jgi:hypothetical protein
VPGEVRWPTDALGDQLAVTLTRIPAFRLRAGRRPPREDRGALALDASLQAVAEVEVQRRWRNQQHSPDTDAKANARYSATVEANAHGDHAYAEE